MIKPQDLVTIINALLGFTAILMIVQSSSNTSNAAILIILAVLADGLDGAIARSLEYGVLGGQLDSLADIISFGMAPAVIAYTLLAPQHHYLICMVGGLFLTCGILRLARFNIGKHAAGFTGLPITSAGLAVALYVLFFSGVSAQIFSYGLLVLMTALSFLMVSTIHYFKIKDFRIIGVTVILMVLMVLLFYLGKPAGFKMAAGANFIIMTSYIFTPLISRK